jgi:hypothetical protein
MLEQGLRVERFGLKKAKAFHNIVGRDLDG